MIKKAAENPSNERKPSSELPQYLVKSLESSAMLNREQVDAILIYRDQHVFKILLGIAYEEVKKDNTDNGLMLISKFCDMSHEFKLKDYDFFNEEALLEAILEVLVENEKFDEIIQIQKTLSKNENLYIGWLSGYFALAYLKANKLQEARIFFDESTEYFFGEGLEEFQFELVITYLETLLSHQKIQEAYDFCSKMADSEITCCFAQAFANLGQMDKALIAVKQAEELENDVLSTDGAEIFFKLHIEAGKEQEALGYIDDFTKEKPGYRYHLSFCLAKAYQATKKYKEALSIINKLLEMEPQDEEALELKKSLEKTLKSEI